MQTEEVTALLELEHVLRDAVTGNADDDVACII